MINSKYKLMKKVYKSTLLHPVSRRDIYRKSRKKIIENKFLLDSLVQQRYLKEDPSGTFTLTQAGIAELEKDIERRQDISRSLMQFWLSAMLSAIAVAVSIVALIR